MRIKVEFEAESEDNSGKNFLVKLPKVNGVAQPLVWIPAEYCTPILPDFGRGDVVEWKQKGLLCQGMVAGWEYQESPVAGPLLAVMDAFGEFRTPTAADCRIVRKAGEEG